MGIVALFAAQGILVIGGAIAYAVWLRRKLGQSWLVWVFGGIAFVASQLARIPLLLVLTAVLQATNIIPRDADPNFVFAFNLFVLSITSGLFEETSRYVVLRWVATGARDWPAGVMFGAGHGGIEAILLVGGSAISNLLLALNGDAMLAAMTAASPDQAAALATQIAAVRGVQVWQIGASILERVFAIALHTGLTLMVLRTVRERTARWWALAVLLHAGTNAAALVAMRLGGIPAAEVAAALGAGIALWPLVISRGLADPGPPPEEPPAAAA